MDKEEINLEERENIDVNSLAAKIPTDHARYHLFRLPHSHNGDHLNSIGNVFTTMGRFSKSLKFNFGNL